MMMISMIAAMAKNRLIGSNNDLPWYLPQDMRHFMHTTMHKPIVMGRKTFESLGSKPLRERANIVVTRDENFKSEGCEIYHSAEAVMQAFQDVPELVIIGGASIYTLFLPYADRLYLTFVDADLQGDSFFPDYQQYTWYETHREQHHKDDKHAYDYSFVTLERKK